MNEYSVEINIYDAPSAKYNQIFPLTKKENIIGEIDGLFPEFVISSSSEGDVVASCENVVVKGRIADGKCLLIIPFYGVWKVVNKTTGSSKIEAVNEVKQYKFSLS